jgi:hypothetical protein
MSSVRGKGDEKMGYYLAIKAHPKYLKEGKLNVNLVEFMKYSILCGYKSGESGKKIDRAVDKIAKDTDIIEMAKIIKQVERLKQITLREDQLVLFDSIKDSFFKPVVDKPFGEVYRSEFDAEDEFCQAINFQELDAIANQYRAYIKLSRSGSVTNKKILDQLDQDTLTFFRELEEVVGDDFGELPSVFANSLKAFKVKNKK